MSSTLSPNMNLIVPGVGTEDGPQYAIDVNNSLAIIDQHTHAPGSGVAITPNALNINSALTFNSNFATGLAGLTLIAQSLTPAINTIYQSGTDLYFVDGAGNNVRLTQSGGVAGSPGSISNLTPPASASYIAGNSTFVWQSGASIAANMDAGALLMRNLTPNSTFALTLQPPAALSSNYSITLPVLPAAQSVMTMDTSGVISTQLQTSLVPPGVISAYGGAVAPAGYLICDGSSVSRTTYADLFAVIGTAYGTADAFSFNVPELRGQFIRGVSGTSGFDPDAASRTAVAIGGNTGNNVGSGQLSELGSHMHTYTDPGHFHTSNPPGPSTALLTPGASLINIINGTAPVSTDSKLTGITINNTGGAETRPTNVYANYIIKT